MKILIVGGEGLIGSYLKKHFSKEHDVTTAGRKSGDLTVDISDSNSIVKLFAEAGTLDAVISVAGEAKWASLDELSEEDYYIGIKSKLMGQVNLARIARKILRDGGSITLSTGILADRPVKLTSSAAMVNGAIHSFVKAAALEMDKGIRINALSSGLVEEAEEKYRDYFPGHVPVPMESVAQLYDKIVQGNMSGQVLTIYEKQLIE